MIISVSSSSSDDASKRIRRKSKLRRENVRFFPLHTNEEFCKGFLGFHVLIGFSLKSDLFTFLYAREGQRERERKREIHRIKSISSSSCLLLILVREQRGYFCYATKRVTTRRRWCWWKWCEILKRLCLPQRRLKVIVSIRLRLRSLLRRRVLLYNATSNESYR